MNSWLRRHWSDKAIAFAIWFKGRCEASVYDGEPSKVSFRVPCDTEDEAKARADDLLLKAYPHDCGKEECGSWERMASPGA